ncbi:hypothetical protein POM88_024552 [Heracleum sosnowskyi]|uniref:Uncharacterized protein n=1 Tax=Heracleum sosnowskyi TaxID=360622 RepID=A0AAD8MMZ6_9APIA|nr:hypothetical protein POM88_024552 [Heracleum sosnowskyi]
MYGVVMFDYYGGNEFGVKVFKNDAVEANYRRMTPSKFVNSDNIVDGMSLQYQKEVALWSFNAFQNYVDYFEMKITKLHIDGRHPYLRMCNEFEKLFKDLEVEKVKLKVGDTLVLFKTPSSGDYIVNVCLFSGKEEIVDDKREKKVQFERSFLKVVTQHCLEEGTMAPLFNRKYPLFVVIMDRDSMVFNEMILPERLTVECSEKIPHNVKLMMPNGREIHVHFNRNEQCLSPMHEFINDCKRLFGSTMLYSYEGSGKFLVHVLKEDFCEVDYFTFRTIPRAKVYDQDNINGIGWKFIVLATGTTIKTGEICEASFVKRENNRLSLLAWRKKNGGAIGNGRIRYSTGK